MADDLVEAESVRFKGRKRLHYEDQWKRKKRKLMKDSGKAYETYKGEIVAAKSSPNISCRCNFKCSTRLNSTQQKRTFDEFYGLKSHDTQNKYLYGLIKKVQIKRKRIRGSNRSVTYQYYVRLTTGSEVRVCKKAFCEIHRIGRKRVDDLCKKLSDGETIVRDNRGKHTVRPHTISDEHREKVRDHIAAFPRWQSHYSRGDNQKREYLPEGLSIAQMYRLYVAKHEPQADKPIVKEWLYRKIFNEQFNLSFGYPRSDTCQLCDELKIAIPNASLQSEQDELRLKLSEHQLKASHGYQALREDTEKAKSDTDLLVITFDLQQNLPVPTLTHSSMFYLRQLWVYNFGIHNCGTGSATMCIWNETIAGRGANEIISCLLHFLHQLRSNTTRLVCCSDSCFGQNKNFSMICFWNTLIVQKVFDQIDHKFLVRGHTYLPNDRDFSHIEKRRRLLECMFLTSGKM